MERAIDCVRLHWQLLLIASLPGSLLRVWAVMHPVGTEDALELSRLALWGAQYGLLTMVAGPLLIVAALLLHESYRDRLPALGFRAQWASGQAPAAMRLDAMTAAARELLTAVSSRGEFRVVSRLAGNAVVAPGTGRNDDREFYDPANREVTQRYREALAELERAGLIERDGEARRLSAVGWPAARLLTRQELDRIAQGARHLAEPEQRLLRLIDDCRQRYKVDKVVLRRDGSSMSAVHDDGQTVAVFDVCPLRETFPGSEGGADAARFEQLVAAIPASYLVLLTERRLGNPFVLRVTAMGLRYLRYADVACPVAA